MRSAVRVWNTIRKAEDLILVGIVVLKYDIGEDVLFRLLAVIVVVDLAFTGDDDG